MSRNTRRSHYGLTLAVFLVILLACDAHTAVRGIVSENNGRPITGASVSLIAIKSGRTVKMDSWEDGSFSVGITHGPFGGRFRLVISKPGYVTFSHDVQANTREQIAVVLTPQQDKGNPQR